MALPLTPYYSGMRPGMMGGAGAMLDPMSMLSMSGPGMGMYGANPLSMISRGLGMPFGAMQDPLGMSLRSGMMRPPLSLSLDYEDIYDFPRRRPRRGLLRRASYGDRSLWDDDFDDWDEMDPEDVLTLLLRRMNGMMRGRGMYAGPLDRA